MDQAAVEARAAKARAALRAMDSRIAPDAVPVADAARAVPLGEDWMAGQRARHLNYLRMRAIAKGLVSEDEAVRLDAMALSRLLGQQR